MPNREQSPSFLRANTLKQRSEETIDFLKTLLNSVGFINRALTGNVAWRGGFVCQAWFFICPDFSITRFFNGPGFLMVRTQEKAWSIRQTGAYGPWRDEPG